MKDNIEVPKFNYTLSEEEEARWLCLIERVNHISEKIDNSGYAELDFNDKKVCRKVYKALVGYINERYNAMLYDVHCANKN